MTELSQYDNSWYSPGRGFLTRLVWFFIGLPLLRSSLIPSSGMRVRLLRLFGARIGDGVVIKPGVRVKYPWHLTVGPQTWIGEDAWVDNLAPVEFGTSVCVSQGAYFCTGNHDWSDERFGLIVKPIRVMDGAWVGAKAVLTPGVELDTCAIAAAGSVIMKNVPAYEVHAGNPAAFVRKRVFRKPASPRAMVEDLTRIQSVVGNQTEKPAESTVSHAENY